MEEQFTTITFFRFNGFKNRFFAFSQMGMPFHPEKIEGLIFSKKVGTGAGYGFSAVPNFGVYGWLNVWKSKTHWEKFRAQHSDWHKWLEHSSENWTTYLKPIKVHGTWNNKQPFLLEVPAPEGEWVAAITRATIKWKNLILFWRMVPGISRKMQAMAKDLFSIGFGEVPFRELATFSIWSEVDFLEHFAYQSPEHKKAIQLTRKYDWFEEELFARFIVVGVDGSWTGFDALPKMNEKYGSVL